jgi:hypothetical protein
VELLFHRKLITQSLVHWCTAILVAQVFLADAIQVLAVVAVQRNPAGVELNLLAAMEAKGSRSTFLVLARMWCTDQVAAVRVVQQQSQLDAVEQMQVMAT